MINRTAQTPPVATTASTEKTSPTWGDHLARRRQEEFDFVVIDMPEEVLLMPTVDMIAGMAVSRLQEAAGPGHLVHGRLEAAGRVMNYATDPETLGVKCDLDQGTFGFNYSPTPDGGFQIEGSDVRQVLQPFPGGIRMSGQVGSFACDQTLTLDPMGALSGHIGQLEGHVGKDTLSVSLRVCSDGQSVEALGQLGTRAILQRVSPGPNDTLVIEGHIGELPFKQTLWTGPAIQPN